MMYLDIDFGGLFLFGVHRASEIYRFMSFAQFEMCFFFQVFLAPPSFSSPSTTDDTNVNLSLFQQPPKSPGLAMFSSLFVLAV